MTSPLPLTPSMPMRAMILFFDCHSNEQLPPQMTSEIRSLARTPRFSPRIVIFVPAKNGKNLEISSYLSTGFDSFNLFTLTRSFLRRYASHEWLWAHLCSSKVELNTEFHQIQLNHNKTLNFSHFSHDFHSHERISRRKM